MNKISVGNCGEYFVAAELERRGFSVAVLMSNTELFDILAFNRTTYNQIAIQVKTTSKNINEWTLSSKSEKIKKDNIFYVFVKLNELNPPEYFIVSSIDVANFVADLHQNWLNTPGRKGQAHNDTSMRKFLDPNNKYLNNWQILFN